MIKVIVGPMFSGKSTTLINCIKERPLSDYVSFKPLRDTRQMGIHSRDSGDLPAINLMSITDIYKHISKVKRKLILIDEIHMFEDDAYKTLFDLHKNYHDIICCGLNMSIAGVPIQTTANVLAIATDIVKLTAKCSVCEAPAEYTFKTQDTHEIIGDSDLYEARCLKHAEAGWKNL